MNKNFKYFLAILLIALFSAVIIGSKTHLKSFSNSLIAYADDHEDEEDEEEHEDEDDDDDDDDEKSSNTEETVEYETVEEPIIVQTTTVVVSQGFDVDTDGDKLVDKIDPNPTILEIELFTDDDLDGVPNAYDHFQGEDDYTFVEFVDTNSNGIVDDLEPKQ